MTDDQFPSGASLFALHVSAEGVVKDSNGNVLNTQENKENNS